MSIQGAQSILAFVSAAKALADDGRFKSMQPEMRALMLIQAGIEHGCESGVEPIAVARMLIGGAIDERTVRKILDERESKRC